MNDWNDWRNRMKTPSCPKCGSEKTGVTSIRTLFDSKPGYVCFQCNYKWPWPNGKRFN